MADKDINIEVQLVTGRNPRGIPTVVFIVSLCRLEIRARIAAI